MVPKPRLAQWREMGTPRSGRQTRLRFRVAPADDFLGARLFQRRTFVHRDMVGLVALDFILRIIWGRVVRISLVIRIFRMNLDDLAADMTGLRVPGHMIANVEFCRHDGYLRLLALT